MKPDPQRLQEDFQHLKETFASVCKSHPNLMEPYVILLDGVDDIEEQTAIMRRGLRETIRQRYPIATSRRQSA